MDSAFDLPVLSGQHPSLRARMLERVGLWLTYILALARSLPGFVARLWQAPRGRTLLLARLFVLVRALLSVNLPVMVVTGAVMGRLLNGGLMLDRIQSLALVYGLREPLLKLAIAHLLPSIVALMVLARGGAGIAVRTALARVQGQLCAIETADGAALDAVLVRWVWPRVAGAGLVSTLLLLGGLLGLIVGFAVDPQSMGSRASLETALTQWNALNRLVPGRVWLEGLSKALLMGALVSASACFQGLRERGIGAAAWRVVGPSFRSGLLAAALVEMLALLLPG